MMRRVRALLLRLAGLVGVGRRDREIAEELRIHREMLSDEYRRAGLGDTEAQRRAAADFGSLASAEGAYRDRRGVPILENWLRDGRLAFRSLWRSPAMCASMIGVLGLGVGFSASIATVLYAVAWRDLPVAEPAQVVRIATDYDGRFSHQVLGGGSQLSYPDFADYRSRTQALVSVAAMTHERTTWRRDTEATTLSAAFVTDDYFRTLEVAPELGRVLVPSDRQQTTVVISYRLWVTAFDGKADTIGQAMSLDRALYTIVGVAPASFTGTEVAPVDVWLPLEVVTRGQGHADRLDDRRAIWLQGIGRLAPRTTITAAAAEAAVVFKGLDAQIPERQTTVRVARASRLDTLGLLRSHEAPILISAATVAGLVMVALLVVCGSNAAALLLARGASRQKEMAVRLALGASRRRLAQQLLAEIGLIALASVLVGVAVCMGALRVLMSQVATGGLVPSTLVPDAGVLLSSISFAILVAFFFGLAPLRQALQVDCLANLKGEVSTWGRRVTAARFRRGLVATQVAISVVLLVAATLLGRGVSQSLEMDPGYVTRGLFIVKPDVNPRPTDGPSELASPVPFRVRDLLTQVPGIDSVAAMAISPYGGSGSNSARAEGMSAPIQVRFNEIDTHYFPVLGVHASAGRLLRIDDTDAAVVNTRLARLFWGSDEKAIGQRFQAAVAGYGTASQSIEVVGVIPAVQTTTAGVPDEATYYVPLLAQRASSAFLLVRARPDVRVAAVAADTARAVDPDALTTTTTLDDRLSAMTVPARIGAVAAGLLGMLALLVSAVGIHGIVAHAVTARTRDIGVYQALGAPTGRVIRLVLGWTLRGVAIGVVSGSTVVAIVVMAFPTLVRAALLGLNPLDPLAIIGAAAFLATVIFGAAYLPARRALGIGPLAALRHE